MSQLFQLQLATENLTLQAQQLGVSTQQLLAIQITVSASLVAQSPLQLYLHYKIHLPSSYLADQLHWPQWQQQHVKFTDYLWENTCLECFIADARQSKSKSKSSEDSKSNDSNKDHDSELQQQFGYIEINASPNGSYAVYRFNRYRYPSSLPPIPLLQPNSSQRASINWSTTSADQSKLSKKLTTLSKLTYSSINLTYNPLVSPDHSHHIYECAFTLSLDQLEMTSINNDDEAAIKHRIGLLHPCVILSFDKAILYFAPMHATPPDFHQRQYWTVFNP